MSFAGTVTFAIGDQTESISVDVIGDIVDEADETFTVDLSGESNAVLTGAQGTVTIADDDTPQISIGDATVGGEGADGSTIAVTLTVVLDIESSVIVEVDYATVDNSATAGDGDYVTTSGSVSFNPGVTSQTISVTVNGDDIDEIDETFFVVLSNGINALILDGSATVTITDDDTVSLAIASATSHTEDAGTVANGVRVTMTGISSRPVSVDFDSIDGTAIAGTDYVGVSGTLTWPAGTTGDQVSPLTISDDNVDEVTETFTIVLSGATSGASIGTPVGTVSIVDNDTTDLVVNDVTFGESAGVVAGVSVELVGESDRTISVSFIVSSGTASSSSDFVPVTSSLTWIAGETGVKTAPVTITHDTIDEVDETAVVTISGQSPASTTMSRSSGTLTITDDDTALFSVGDVSVAEDGVSATVTVSLSTASAVTTSVNYATSGVDATAGSDFTSVSGTLTLSPGVVSQTFVVLVADDAIDEVDETVTITLSGEVGAGIDVGVATLTIVDNDDATLSVEAATHFA